MYLFSSSILFSQSLNVPPPSSRLLSLFLAFFEPLEKGCLSAVQAKDKSPHTDTHTHTHTHTPYSLSVDHQVTHYVDAVFVCVCSVSLALL